MQVTILHEHYLYVVHFSIYNYVKLADFALFFRNRPFKKGILDLKHVDMLEIVKSPKLTTCYFVVRMV